VNGAGPLGRNGLIRVTGMEMNDIIKLSEADGWYQADTKRDLGPYLNKTPTWWTKRRREGRALLKGAYDEYSKRRSSEDA